MGNWYSRDISPPPCTFSVRLIFPSEDPAQTLCYTFNSELGFQTAIKTVGSNPNFSSYQLELATGRLTSMEAQETIPESISEQDPAPVIETVTDPDPDLERLRQAKRELGSRVTAQLQGTQMESTSGMQYELCCTPTDKTFCYRLTSGQASISKLLVPGVASMQVEVDLASGEGRLGEHSTGADGDLPSAKALLSQLAAALSLVRV